MMVMADKGYDRATVTDVARAAGLAPGLVHYHFDSKLEILLALAEQLKTDLEATLDAIPDEATTLERLDALIDRMLGRPDRQPQRLAVWIALGQEALKDERVGRVYGETLESLAKRIRSILLGDERRRSRDVESTTVAVVAIIQGYLSLAGTRAFTIPRGTAAPCAKSMVRGLIS